MSRHIVSVLFATTALKHNWTLSASGNDCISSHVSRQKLLSVGAFDRDGAAANVTSKLFPTHYSALVQNVVLFWMYSLHCVYFALHCPFSPQLSPCTPRARTRSKCCWWWRAEGMKTPKGVLIGSVSVMQPHYALCKSASFDSAFVLLVWMHFTYCNHPR